MKENDILSFFYRLFSYPEDRGLKIGPKDDCAVLDLGAKKMILATVDEIYEGSHFKRHFSSPALLAGKLVRMNVSDIYSMGSGIPKYCFVAGGFGGGISLKWIKEFSEALKKEANLFEMKVAGGNLCKSDKIHFSMTVLGFADRKKLVLREGAQEGDVLMGVGDIGLSKAGLEILLSGKKANKGEKKLTDAFWKPKICVKEAAILARYAKAMMDNSDGLYKSLLTLSQSNKLKIKAVLNEKFLDPVLLRYCLKNRKDWRKHCLEGGEDYGLIFAVSKKDVLKIKKLIPKSYILGFFCKGSNVEFENYEGKAKPFEHF